MIHRWLPALAGVTLSYCAQFAPAHEGGDALSAWYRSLRTPEGGLCCSEADCRPIEARLAGDHWEIATASGWLPVPPERVLKRDNADGRPIACILGGRVLCFVPGNGV